MLRLDLQETQELNLLSERTCFIVDFPFTGLASITYLPLRLWKQSELLSEISGLCHGGKVATQSVGNMLASVVTHLPVL